MALQLDATAFGALTKLLDKVTDKHESHQDAVALQQIKAFCKQSDENITWLSTVLLHRLKEDHAQVLHNTSPLITPKSQVVCFANTTGPCLSPYRVRYSATVLCVGLKSSWHLYISCCLLLIQVKVDLPCNNVMVTADKAACGQPC